MPGVFLAHLGVLSWTLGVMLVSFGPALCPEVIFAFLGVFNSALGSPW